MQDEEFGGEASFGLNAHKSYIRGHVGQGVLGCLTIHRTNSERGYLYTGPDWQGKAKDPLDPVVMVSIGRGVRQ